MYFRKSFLLGLLVSAAPASVYAQETPSSTSPAPDASEEELEGEEEAIVVTGQRLRGAVAGDIPPEVQLDARDIRAYGAGSLSELLEALAPQTQSGAGRGGGRPVILLNGRRISGFSEIRDLPPEAVERVDILPEEVALKYGYRADQRVVNFVLRPRFRAITGEVAAGIATEGGRGSYEADLNVLRITNDGRWNVDAEFRRQTPLFESERDLIQVALGRPFALGGNVASTTPGAQIDPALSEIAGQPVTVIGIPASATIGIPTLGGFAGTNAGNSTDLGSYRTLLPETDQFSLAGTINRTIFSDISATLNARYEQVLSKSRFGLPAVTFTVPAGNPYSPFASDVSVYRYYEGIRPLTRESDSRTAHLGLVLNGDIVPWRWSFTANYDRANNSNISETNPDLAEVQARIVSRDPTINPFAPLAANAIVSGPRDRSRSLNQSGDAELVASGSLLDLPAGPISATVRLGADTRSLESESVRGGAEQIRDLSRNRIAAQTNIDVPIASRRNDVLSAIGDLSVNGNAEIEHLSDFGTLKTIGAGINWSPIREVRLLATVTDEDGAPSIQQLGDPTVLVPNVRVFDFTRGQTVDISRLEGGNPDLRADNRRVLKLSANVKPFEETDLSLTVNYVNSRLRNLISSFPTATPEIEAAFPDRFVRDQQGQLLRIDSRPVNFERANRQEIRWGLNFSKPIASTPRGGLGGGRPGGPGGGAGGRRGRAAAAGEGVAPGAPGADAQAPATIPAPPTDVAGTARAPGTERGVPPEGRAELAPQGGTPGGQGGRGFGGGRGGFGGAGGGRQGGRIQFSLYHTLRLQDEILIREGVPVLDLLGGSATGSRGGQPRHEIEAQAGLFKDGYGARLNANWQSGTTVRGVPDGTGASTGDLNFSDFATINLRLFADLGQQRSLVRQHRWLRGTRVTLSVDNLFNNRIGVTNKTGATPLSYQGAYLGPLGRSVRLSIRKQFF